MKLRKALLILICLIAALALTACQEKTDPILTVGPTPTPTIEMIIQSEPTVLPTVEIVVQGEPTATPATQQQVVEQTSQPGGDEAPGLNG